nr:MAG TPA: hypothetical protein [Caudoviricetes sp.]
MWNSLTLAYLSGFNRLNNFFQHLLSKECFI